MGGGPGGYEGDVAERARSTDTNLAQVVTREVAQQLTISHLQNPKKLIRECRDNQFNPETTPIVVITDITLTRAKDIQNLYVKLPMLMGQIVMQGYATDPEICFAAVGDATYGDKFPIQIGEFESDNKLDDSLKAIIREEGGGGGTGQESYQLMAYFFAYHSVLDSLEKRHQKGKCFFIGDEGFYSKVSRKEVQQIFGETIPNDLDSAEVFKKLQEKYDVFFIYPKKPWEQRKEGIDAEIRDRVEKAGGRFKGVDIRASLAWNDYTDLDLHCITPTGFEIYFPIANKKSPCGGELDVDCNAGGPQTRKAVENIVWAKGKAKKGHYRFFVENYAYHEPGQHDGEVPFTVLLEVNGETKKITAKTPNADSREGRRAEVASFDYDPAQRQIKEADYAGYDDAVILQQWTSVLPAENVIKITDSKGVVDIILGVLALWNGRSLEDYITDMKNRDQTEPRQNEIRTALADLSLARGLEKVMIEGLPKLEKPAESDKKSKRL